MAVSGGHDQFSVIALNETHLHTYTVERYSRIKSKKADSSNNLALRDQNQNVNEYKLEHN